MNEFTPAPWEADETGFIFPAGGPEPIAKAFGSVDELYIPMAANAQLIAAAPELLEALTAAIGDFDAPCPHCQGKGKIPGSRNWVAQAYVEADCFHCGGTGRRYNLNWFPAAKAAIAKALGQQVEE